MKLISLDLKNFRQHVDSCIEFSDGVTGIVGPNGGGKSTVLEAMAWALYGAPAVRGTNDTIRSKASEGGAKVSVTLEFELGGSIYRVTRTLDGSGRTGSAVLQVDGKPLRSGLSEVSDAITRLLGMDYRAFFTSFFTAQKELDFMSGLDGRARANMIGRMLGYERLTKARDAANDDRKGLNREIEGLEKGLADPEDLKERKQQSQAAVTGFSEAVAQAETALKAAQTERDKLKPLKEASEQKAKRFSEIERRVELDRAEVRRTQERTTQLTKDLAELDAKRKELDVLKPDLDRYVQAGEEYKKLRALQEHEGERQRLAGQIASAEAELKSLESRLKQLSDAAEKQTRAGIALAEGEEQLKKLEQKIQSSRETRISEERGCQARIEQTEARIAQLLNKRGTIAEAGVEGVCPTCERPLADELPKVLAHFDEEAAALRSSLDQDRLRLTQLKSGASEIEKLSSDKEKLATQVDALRRDKAKADSLAEELDRGRKDAAARAEAIAQIRAQIDKLPGGFDPIRFKELQTIHDQFQPVWSHAIELKTDLKREPDTRTELGRLTQDLAAKTKLITENEATLKGLDFRQDQHEDLMLRHDHAARALSAAEVDTATKRGELNTAAALMQSIEKEEQDFKKRMDVLKQKREDRLHLQALSDAFDKLRIELNDQIRPELEAIAGELLSTMTDGRYSVLEIDESYEARIRDDGELKPVISGGEQDIVNLALRLAISQMIADRAGQSFSLLVLDEVFGSLDDMRRDNVIALLQNLKNRFEQIIIITHIESIHDAIDNCLWVRFDERTKTSRLSERSIDLEPPMAGVLTLMESEGAPN